MNNHYKEMQDKLKYVLGEEILKALSDPEIIELMCNEDGMVWIDSFDGMKQCCILESTQTNTIICTVAGMTDQIIDRENPDLSAEMPLLIDGKYILFRFQGMIYPTVLSPIFSIRKPSSKVYSWQEYIQAGVMTQDEAAFLRKAIHNHFNIIVAGGTASGKTTFANTLLLEIADQFPQERIALLQDTLELQSPSLNKFQLRTSESRNMDELLRSTLRLRPDRIIVGEVRGKECLTLIKSWGTGHPGGIATLHSNSANQSLARIEHLIHEAGVVPVKEVIAQTINVIVYLCKTNANRAGRIVQEIVEVNGFDREFNEYQVDSIFNDEPIIRLGRNPELYELLKLN